MKQFQKHLLICMLAGCLMLISGCVSTHNPDTVIDQQADEVYSWCTGLGGEEMIGVRCHTNPKYANDFLFDSAVLVFKVRGIRVGYFVDNFDKKEWSEVADVFKAPLALADDPIWVPGQSKGKKYYQRNKIWNTGDAFCSTICFDEPNLMLYFVGERTANRKPRSEWKKIYEDDTDPEAIPIPENF